MNRIAWRLLRWSNRAGRAVAERLTPAGRLALGAAGAAALAGVNTNQTLTYQAFAFLVVLLVFALLSATLFRARLRIERELPRLVTAGEPFSYSLTVHNLGSRVLRELFVFEHFRDPRPSYEAWRKARDPRAAERNLWDRTVASGYFRWRWLIERRLPHPPGETFVANLAPGASLRLSLSMTPRRRGRLEFAGVSIARAEPLGLARGLRRVAQEDRVLALPRRYRLPELALAQRRRHQRGGISHAASVGDSEEFLGLREYRPGDPLQRIHWKSTARTGVPIVREMQDEYFERHALALDTSPDAAWGAQSEPVFEDAVALAASFAYTIDTRECLLDLLFVGDRTHAYTAGRGQLQASHLLEILAGVEPAGPQAAAEFVRAVLARRDTLTSCILILVGWDDARRELVRALQGTGVEVRALLVCPKERTPDALPGGVSAVHPGEIEAGLASLR